MLIILVCVCITNVNTFWCLCVPHLTFFFLLLKFETVNNIKDFESKISRSLTFMTFTYDTCNSLKLKIIAHQTYIEYF